MPSNQQSRGFSLDTVKMFRDDAVAAGYALVSPGCPGGDIRHHGGGMPTISTFYGILIRMFFNDHPPPHFHAIYGEFQATIDTERLKIREGELPKRALELVLEWARQHQAELLDDWQRCREKQAPYKIEPLS